MSLLVLQPGLATTVQDQGRPGFREWGVPVGGAFDRGSAGLANALVGNGPESAVLEMTILGGEFEARLPMALAIAGPPWPARLVACDGTVRTLASPTSFSMAAGDRLRVGTSNEGARAYLAVREGWETQPVLGSRSSETRLQAGDILPASAGSIPGRRLAEVFWVDPTRDPLRIINGPDSCQEAPFGLEQGLSWRVGAQSSRMGLRLEGPPLPRIASADRISTPVAPGAVQLAGEQLIVLGVACGTMGGYPHIAHVISADLDRVGQLRPGDLVRFQAVTLEEARRADTMARSTRSELFRKLAAIAADPGGQSEPD